MDNSSKITKKQIAVLLLLFILLVSLPIAVFLTRQKQEIRPRAALPGQANFKLVTSDETPDPGETFTVQAAFDITDPNVRVSGVDFRILYSKDLLESVPIVDVESSVGGEKPFTDVLVKEIDKPYSDDLNYLRLVLAARKLTPKLSGGNDIPLAKITFKAKEKGAAVIKYPEKNKDQNGALVMQVVGVDLNDQNPTPTAGGRRSTPTPSPTSKECRQFGEMCNANAECCSGVCKANIGGLKICIQGDFKQ